MARKAKGRRSGPAAGGRQVRSALPELELRRVATEKTRAKYLDTAFDWRSGRHCLALARFQARAMGHKPPPMPRVRSALAAKKELQQRGHADVIALLDSQFARIAPAAMLLGDLCAVPGEAGLDAVFVNIAPGKAMGWREDAPALVALALEPQEISAAWRL